MNKFFLVSIVIFVLLIAILMLTNKIDNKEQETMNNLQGTNIEIVPIGHASMILNWDGKAIYTDPSVYKMNKSSGEVYSGKPDADIVLLTDIHNDHLDQETLQSLVKKATIIIAPKAVYYELSPELRAKAKIMQNGDKIDERGFSVEAIPAYNLPGPSEQYHSKGRGNGYVVEAEGKRVYISGDTAGISEMRALQNIDIAFVAMNLPYTMSVEEAADAVLDFKPKQVYPYHFRTPEGFSDVMKFKELINASNSNIEVILLNWYPK